MRFSISKILLIILIVSVSFSQDNYNPDAEFKKANKHFINSEYEKAIEIYERLQEKEIESFELFYNLGSAYYKLKKIPQSILYFERAKRINPDDEDVNFNLNVANLRVVDKIEPIPYFFLFEWIDIIRQSFSVKSWTWFTIIFIWVAVISLTCFFLFWSPTLKKGFFGISILCFLFAICSLIFTHHEFIELKTQDKAIIFSPSVYVKSSPGDNGTKLFILHEGTKVQILDKVGEWKKIRILNGNIGWIPESSMELI